MQIFSNDSDYRRFLRIIQYYQIAGVKPKFSLFNPKIHTVNREKKIVEIICYCFMPNHFHLLLQQVQDSGITEFMGKVSNSYTRYYNTKYDRVGPLLQGEFKAVHVEDDEQVLHLSRYIHLNPLVGNVVKDLDSYPWSSYQDYLMNTRICSKEKVLSHFTSAQEYKQFVLDREDYGRQLKYLKHQLLEDSEV